MQVMPINNNQVSFGNAKQVLKNKAKQLAIPLIGLSTLVVTPSCDEYKACNEHSSSKTEITQVTQQDKQVVSEQKENTNKEEEKLPLDIKLLFGGIGAVVFSLLIAWIREIQEMNNPFDN